MRRQVPTTQRRLTSIIEISLLSFRNLWLIIATKGGMTTSMAPPGMFIKIESVVLNPKSELSKIVPKLLSPPFGIA
ncbi:hypothetical protein OGATHE_003265 [Ogataea polymorpha]|uniref:Uncharacterized protein n=1 Tax=Ogataea polymorpha TaxID=460523 RepID=A0A9P8P3L9_9ASCO|nr:hypothetical protein OGATHE_003265 [Ogataea polymorpha]